MTLKTVRFGKKGFHAQKTNYLFNYEKTGRMNASTTDEN